jgi:hypothetical protein
MLNEKDERDLLRAASLISQVLRGHGVGKTSEDVAKHVTARGNEYTSRFNGEDEYITPEPPPNDLQPSEINNDAAVAQGDGDCPQGEAE